MDAERDDLALDRHLAAESGLNHSLKGPDGTSGPRNGAHQSAQAIGMAHEFKRGLSSQGALAAKEQDLLTGFETGHQRHNGVFPGERMFRARISLLLAGARMMIHNRRRAGADCQSEVRGGWNHKQRRVLSCGPDEDQVLVLSLVPGYKLTALQREVGMAAIK